MSYLVRHGRELVGEVQFEAIDEGMGVAMGPFQPAEAYRTVQSLFRELSAALESPGVARALRSKSVDALFCERDALDLTLCRSNGDVVPTAWIMIYDHSAELGPTGLACEVQLATGASSLS